MDPSLRSSLFNQMMQALELGDKATADKIELLIRNFHPDSPPPIFIHVPRTDDDATHDIPFSSFGRDSPPMTRPSKASGSGRKALKAPKALKESPLDAQVAADSDIEEHRLDGLYFSRDNPSSFDCEVNVVGDRELRHYRRRFDIPSSVNLLESGDRAAWNPVPGAVAIYGVMLSCGVTLPLQGFIARFLADARLSPAQLAPNSYRILMGMWMLWTLKGYEPPTPREICHFYSLRLAGHGGTYFLSSTPAKNWIPKGAVNPGKVQVSEDEKEKGFLWGLPSSNKRWKNSWFFISGDWHRGFRESARRNLRARRVPRHFTSPDSWCNSSPLLSDKEVAQVAKIATTSLAERGISFLLNEERMIAGGLFPPLHARLRRCKSFLPFFPIFLFV